LWLSLRLINHSFELLHFSNVRIYLFDVNEEFVQYCFTCMLRLFCGDLNRIMNLALVGPETSMMESKEDRLLPK
jgi:hypothetical protein